MHVSVRQISHFLETDLPAEKLAASLEEIGHEVEQIIECPAVDESLQCAVIARRQRHDQQEGLFVYELHTDHGSLTVVSRIANLPEGASVAVAPAGALVRGETVENRHFAGIDSQAVFVSAADVTLTHHDNFPNISGILRVFPDGIQGSLNDVLSLPDTRILLKPAPNRGDCLSALGIARELAARLQLKWSRPQWSPAQSQTMTHSSRQSADGLKDAAAVAVDSVEHCAYYALATISLGDGSDWSALPSPTWMIEALSRFGQRPVSALVDLTNYCQFMVGQPMHIFDADKIAAPVSVRCSQQGELFSALDHRSISLQANTLVVCDRDKIIALAGIYGADTAAIDNQTKRIAVECACFDAGAVRGRARRYELNTESALRYERGVDPLVGDQALLYFIENISQLIPSATVDGAHIHRREFKHSTAQLKSGLVEQYLGFAPDAAGVSAVLGALGFQAQPGSEAGEVPVQIPSWRSDVSHDVCLIEEILRMGQLARVKKETGFSGAGRGSARRESDTSTWQRQQKIRRDWIGLGFSEVCTYSFISREDDIVFSTVADDEADSSFGLGRPACFQTNFPAEPTGDAPALDIENPDPSTLTIVNPLSSDMAALRRSTIPGLCRLLSFHLNRQYDDVRLFELGSIFRRQPAGIDQLTVCAGLVYGRAFPEQWGHSGRPVDYFDLLGLVRDHLGRFVPSRKIACRRSTQTHLHPLQSADLIVEGQLCGYIGSVHPRIREHFRFVADAFVFEFDASVYQLHEPVRLAQTYSTAPNIRRDLSFLIPADMPSSRVIAEVENFGLDYLRKSSIFDLYTGPNIDSDSKSVSLKLIFGRKNTNLLESEIDHSCQKLIEHLQASLGIRLRN
ncbi:MAG: phenylalanine--tRNA ligase subunit beta [Gammaproteobacteria bacterium]|nr:phenylalanine--tRNA ligase subunit beta [Gammaproteobacteria bacterium]